MLVPLQLSGLNEDLPSWAVPADTWTGARNINFRDQLATRVLGTQLLYGTPNTAPLHVLNSDFGGTNYWLYAGAGIGVVNVNNTHFDITPAVWSTPVTPDALTSTILHGIPVINDDVQTPVWWDRDTANIMTDLPGWPVGATANSMKSFKNFLLAIGYNDGSASYPDRLVWSGAADPGTLPTEWTSTPENLAGDLSFGDTPGGLVDGAPLRGNFVLYKTGATYLLQFLPSSNAVFSQRLLFATSGILARNCVAEVEGKHIVLTDSDVIMHDGQTVQSIVDTRARRELFESMDPDNYANSFVFNFKSRDEVWVCFPENGQTYPNRALVWDKDGNMLGFRDLLGTDAGYPHIGYGNVDNAGIVRTWDAQAYTWDGGSADYTWNSGLSNQAVFGGLAADFAGTELHGVDMGDESAQGSIQGILERHSLDFGAPDKVKMVQRVWPRITGSAGDIVYIRAGSQMDTDSEIDWSPIVQFTIGTDRKVDVAVQGRYLSFEFSTTDGDTYRITGFDVEMSDTGGLF